MHKIINILSFFFFFSIVFCSNIQAQCTINIDVPNIQHISCPNGGAVGSASILQNSYSNYFWNNTTNGQLYPGGTSSSALDAGIYIITGTGPIIGSCPLTSVSSPFEILEADFNFNFNPTQACPNLCDVSVTAVMGVAIAGISYTYQFDSNPVVSLPNSLSNQCGGAHTFEIFADGLSCGIENIGVSQFAQMNLATAETNSTCALLGSSTVSITGVGASGLNTYCTSEPQYATNTTIDNVSVIGDNTSILNNTSGICDDYQDYTIHSADLTPGNAYNLDIDLGTCNPGGPSLAFVDIASVYIDWNIDGDFDDLNELVAQVNPTQSPSSHSFSINVPIGAIPGQSRMRIVAQNSQFQPSNQAAPCDIQSYFGSVEDYTIQVNGSVANPVSYLWSDGQTTVTANNLIAGTYTVTITDANSCTATTTSVVTGNGSGNVTSVIAGTNQTICNGGTPVNLTATGNSSGGAYSWAPVSVFTNPNLQNPSFNNSWINATSVFMVTFTDSSGCTDTDYVTITINPVPSVTLLALPNPACLGDNIVLTAATSIPVNKYKFQSKSVSGWNNVTTPSWDINNSVIHNNITQSTQFRVKIREDNGCAASIWSPTITVPIVTFNNLSIWHN